MPEVKYGTQTINYIFSPKPGLKTHYITVAKGEGVVLKGAPVAPETEQAMVLNKARWILKKLRIVEALPPLKIVTGARIPYLGRWYYAEVIPQPDLKTPQVEFRAGRFQFKVPAGGANQSELADTLNRFYKTKAREKIVPRVRKLAQQTGHSYQQLKFLTMEKRWGSCTEQNNIILNTEAVKLPWNLIDYLIVHELCHTVEKNHSPAFWAEVQRCMPGWREFDELIGGWRL
jgi:hypothetical protein